MSGGTIKNMYTISGNQTSKSNTCNGHSSSGNFDTSSRHNCSHKLLIVPHNYSQHNIIDLKQCR